MQQNQTKIWFPAKKYGWGWGPPNCWQGWVVLAVWFTLWVGGALLILPNNGLFILYAVILGAAIIIACLIKGDKPRWRWGKD
jgi:hypothetical protein